MNTNELPGHPGIMPCADSSLCMEEVNLALLSCSLFCNREEIHLSKKAKKSTEKSLGLFVGPMFCSLHGYKQG